MKKILLILLLIPVFAFGQITTEQVKAPFVEGDSVRASHFTYMVDFINQKVDTVAGKVLIDQDILGRLSAIDQVQKANYRYIFINSTGNDANDGSTPELSVSSITRANAIIAGLPGNRIPVVYLARGDLLVGQLEFNKSGTVDSRAKVLPYGDGDTKPVISGAIDLAALTWVNQGSNVWMAEAPAEVLNVWKGDIQQTIARDTTGYHTMTRAAGVVTIPTIDRPSGEMVGAKVRIRETKYTYVNRTVATWDNTSKAITFDAVFENWTANDARLGYFDGLTAYLDVQDEWAYVNNAGTHEVYVYSTTNPNTFTDYQGSIHDHNINLGSSNISYIEIEGVSLKHAALNAVNFDPAGGSAVASHIKITNTDISRARKRGIQVYNEGGFAENIEITENNISYCGAGGIYGRNIRNSKFNNNTISETFTQQPYGFIKQSEVSEYTLGGYGIQILCATGDLTTANQYNYNIIDQVGMGGIYHLGGFDEVAYNKITYFSLQGDDDGGIYCWGNVTQDRSFNHHWHHNFVAYGPGSTEGYIYPNNWESLVVGLYCDQGVKNTHLHHNTVIDVAGKGILFNRHNRRNQADHNIVANCGKQIELFADDAGAQAYDHVVTNNAFISLTSSQVGLIEFNQAGGDFDPGFIDYNHYVHPMGRVTHVRDLNTTGSMMRMNLAEYQAATGRDMNSTFDDLILDSLFSEVELGAEKIIGDNVFDTNIGNLGHTHPDDGDLVWNSRNGGVAVVTHHSEIDRNNFTVYFQNAQFDGTFEKGKSYLIEFPLRSEVDTNYVHVILENNNQGRFRRYVGFDATQRVCQLIYTHTDNDFSGNAAIKLRTYSSQGLPIEYELQYLSVREIISYTTIQQVIENMTDKVKSFYPGYTFTDESGMGRHVSLEPFESAYFQFDGTGYKKIKP